MGGTVEELEKEGRRADLTKIIMLLYEILKENTNLKEAYINPCNETISFCGLMS